MLCAVFVVCSGNDSEIKKVRNDYSVALSAYFNSSVEFSAMQKRLDERIKTIDEVAKALQSGTTEAQKVLNIMQEVQAMEAKLQESKGNKDGFKDKFISLSTKSTKSLKQSKATIDNAIAVLKKYIKL